MANISSQLFENDWGGFHTHSLTLPAPINRGVTGIPPRSAVVPRSIAFSVLNGVHVSSRPFFTASSMISDHGSMKYFPVAWLRTTGFWLIRPK
jgi:hypothetical protein